MHVCRLVGVCSCMYVCLHARMRVIFAIGACMSVCMRLCMQVCLQSDARATISTICSPMPTRAARFVVGTAHMLCHVGPQSLGQPSMDDASAAELVTLPRAFPHCSVCRRHSSARAAHGRHDVQRGKAPPWEDTHRDSHRFEQYLLMFSLHVFGIGYSYH